MKTVMSLPMSLCKSGNCCVSAQTSEQTALTHLKSPPGRLGRSIDRYSVGDGVAGGDLRQRERSLQLLEPL
jgi:hypothetical protein